MGVLRPILGAFAPAGDVYLMTSQVRDRTRERVGAPPAEEGLFEASIRGSALGQSGFDRR